MNSDLTSYLTERDQIKFAWQLLEQNINTKLHANLLNFGDVTYRQA
jgi:hypothetical protein